MRTIYRLCFFSFLVFISFRLNAQCFGPNKAFQVGEIIDYNVAYHWGVIWLEAGKVRFSVKEKNYQNRPVYHLIGEGHTLKKHEWLYKVDDYFQSYVDKETLKPLWFRRDTYEGGYSVDNRYTFDYQNNTIVGSIENSDDPRKEITLEMPNCVMDVMSLVYLARTIDFDNLAVDDTVGVTSIIDGEIYNLYIRYLGREHLELKDGRTFNTQKFSALLVEGTIFKGGEDMFVYVTDDRNKIPIMVEAKILIGSVKAIISNVQGSIDYPESVF
ncbi:MAG: DUF3108 domain-containing protein [Bacteroidota bacterium]